MKQSRTSKKVRLGWQGLPLDQQRNVAYEVAGAQFAVCFFHASSRLSYSADFCRWYAEQVYQRYTKLKDPRKHAWADGFRQMAYIISQSRHRK